MRAALEALTPDSRYRRFMSHKTAFTDREVEQLTDVDGVDHVALCAVIERPGLPPEIAGTARYYRLGDESVTAEPAVMVVDGYQGRGLGTTLFRELLAVAAAQGIRWFHCELLGSNVPMRRLIDSVARGTAQYAHAEPDSVMVRFPVGAVDFDRDTSRAA